MIQVSPPGRSEGPEEEEEEWDRQYHQDLEKIFQQRGWTKVNIKTLLGGSWLAFQENIPWTRATLFCINSLLLHSFFAKLSLSVCSGTYRQLDCSGIAVFLPHSITLSYHLNWATTHEAK
ncbi:hypothetical protein I7I50_06812 [Histoplasma capsulatum G186AR]|uniref:Uncharacterized protein n=1 Tax=Ajellomyces capsulatus TaxID=5037 RepID=A0A8H7Z0C8_AJECA|nr:hypothetical protein I7I52_10114 [Histoplasma capsulatum]QSS67666.1 hypothetical protein I7I50_06812 [Histoplasma capsulatum G186AR]